MMNSDRKLPPIIGKLTDEKGGLADQTVIGGRSSCDFESQNPINNSQTNSTYTPTIIPGFPDFWTGPRLDLQESNPLFKDQASAIRSLDNDKKERIKLFHQRLQSIPADVESYSDPNRRTRIPFAYPGNIRHPTFDIDTRDFTFEFMGREEFSRIFSEIETLINGSGGKHYFINATYGWGKSYVLAALAALLLKQGKSVVYISHCAEFIIRGLDYLRTCFFMAYARHEKDLQRVVDLKSYQDISNFVQQEQTVGKRLIFVIDQMECFDLDCPDIHPLFKKQTVERGQMLFDIIYDHALVVGSSANAHMFQPAHLGLRRNCPMNGRFYANGLSTAEVAAWWNHYENQRKLPKLLTYPLNGSDLKTDDVNLRRKEIEYITGSNFDLLNCVLALASPQTPANEPKDWALFKSLFVKQPKFNAIRLLMTEFYCEIAREPEENKRMYFTIVHGCLTKKIIRDYNPKLVDWRFMSIDREGQASCSSGFVASCISELIRINHPDPGNFCSKENYDAIRTFGLS
ncbi:hypothetical protein TWF696_007838 [Orbilia brochopaga]|uniref:Uncharacterized protein n=1 Tax=Orbilia brochopaga TaxID=3140254 RepID=A0AAV9UPR4_9PEZI